jgi:hypothetical protein
MTEKTEFACSAWVEKARQVLEELVAEQGEEGRTFSICERFTDAPITVAASSTAAWHFYIDGLQVRVGEGEVDDTDVKVSADYTETLPNARLVYTPEMLAERARQPPGETSVVVEGDMSIMPQYLIEMHNRMAVLTA